MKRANFARYYDIHTEFLVPISKSVPFLWLLTCENS